MSWRDYIRDRGFVFLSGLGCCGIMALFLSAFRVPAIMTGILFVLFILYMLGITLWDYSRRRGFYQKLCRDLERLDQKYLVTELLEVPDFYEGKIFYNALSEIDKSMYEHVREYQRQAGDFKEYIEMWVHEMKLPIASLLLMCHNDSLALEPKYQAQLRRMDQYTDQVLYYARSENAQKDYLFQEVSWRRAVTNVALKYREDLQEHEISFCVEGEDTRILTDGKWMEFILGQLFQNSIKYVSDHRERQLRVWAEEAALQEAAGLQIHVWDNGLGIPAQDLPSVFHKSFTGSNGRKHAKSTGMGLYIAKKLCDRMGHGLEIFSEEGAYTEVVLTIGKQDFYVTEGLQNRKREVGVREY